MDANTSLIHAPKKSASSTDFDAVMPPLYKASTVFFPNAKAVEARRYLEGDYTYGLNGTPTIDNLAQRLAQLEGGKHCLLVPSGLAAISLVDLALLSSGDEVLIPHNCYAPNAELIEHQLTRFGIAHHLYDPLDLAALRALITPRTRLLWLEAAGSNTLEFPDLIGLIDLATEHGITTALDNTWGAGVAFSPFDLNGADGQKRQVDISIQALTKYPSGGADVLMGSVVTHDATLYRRLKKCYHMLGLGVAANDVELVLRGLPNLYLRYQAQDDSTRTLVQWLIQRPEIETVFHPSLNQALGHQYWQQQANGAAALVSFTLQADYHPKQIQQWCDQLSLFKLGYSWAGPVSLVMFYDLQGEYWHKRKIDRGGANCYLIRLAIGLENPEDLIADLSQAFAQLGAPQPHLDAPQAHLDAPPLAPPPPIQFYMSAADEGQGLIARATAQQLAHQLSHYQDVTLDFSDVQLISADFADEILRVWPLTCPDLHLRIVHANNAIVADLHKAISRSDCPQATGQVLLIN